MSAYFNMSCRRSRPLSLEAGKASRTKDSRCMQYSVKAVKESPRVESCKAKRVGLHKLKKQTSLQMSPKQISTCLHASLEKMWKCDWQHALADGLSCARKWIVFRFLSNNYRWSVAKSFLQICSRHSWISRWWILCFEVKNQIAWVNWMHFVRCRFNLVANHFTCVCTSVLRWTSVFSSHEGSLSFPGCKTCYIIEHFMTHLRIDWRTSLTFSSPLKIIILKAEIALIKKKYNNCALKCLIGIVSSIRSRPQRNIHKPWTWRASQEPSNWMSYFTKHHAAMQK